MNRIESIIDSELDYSSNNEDQDQDQEEEEEEFQSEPPPHSSSMLILERQDSLDLLDSQNDKEEDEEEEEEGGLGKTTTGRGKKRKTSLLTTTGPGFGRWSNPNRVDSSYVSSPPILLPHSAHLPSSSHEFYTTRSHPINKNNFRYTPCGPSPTSSLPITIHRTIESSPQEVRFSWEDRSSFVLISNDAKTITAEKGWRGARANVGMREGNWYWEIKIERGGGEGGREGIENGGEGEGSWVRTGVGRRESPLNAPAGIDGHSYAYRDRGGEAVTLARPRPYGSPYTSGSTIGIYLSLPPRPLPSTTDRRDPSRIIRKRIPIRYKGQLYFESLEYASSREMEDLIIDPATKAKEVVEEAKVSAPGTKSRPPVKDLTPSRELPKLNGSKIVFFKDGICQGIAFEDVFDFLPLRLHPPTPGQPREKKKAGTGINSLQDNHLKVMENFHDDGTLGYFPFVSVFGGGIATINPGPVFEFPPGNDIEKVIRESEEKNLSNSLDIVDGGVEVGEGGGEKNWRPLCERYAEALAEQRNLDDQDELEATKVFEKATLDQGSGLPFNPHLSTNKSSSNNSHKKTKFSHSPVARLASLGVVMLKQEDLTPTPTPSSTAVNGNGTLSPVTANGGTTGVVVKEVAQKEKDRNLKAQRQRREEEEEEEEERQKEREREVKEEVLVDITKAWRGTRSDGFV